MPPSPLRPAGLHIWDREAATQANYWDLVGKTERINFGTVLGTRRGMSHLFDVFLRAVTRYKMNGKLTYTQCNDCPECRTQCIL